MIARLFLSVIAVVCFISCEQGTKQRSLPYSSGRINHMNVVIDKENWQGEIGDALRKVFASPVDGLQAEEPLFTLKQIPQTSFNGFARENRTFLKIQITDSSGVAIDRDVYARPQTGVTIYGRNKAEIIELIEKEGQNSIDAFNKQELESDQKRIARALKSDAQLKEKLGISLKFPTAYRYAKEEDNFFWMRKALSNGDMNILVYEVPLRVIDQDTNTVLRLVRMRDSIGGKKIPVDEGRFITERAFAPSLYKTSLDGKFAWQTKGTWEVQGQRMAGPFVNYAIKDEANGRYLVLEGFIFSPSQEKRDNMFELETILRSIKFVNNGS